MSAFNEAPDFNPEDEKDTDRKLEGEFTRPAEIFQGRPLWPFTKGSKALYNMALSDSDTRLYRVLAFIYIHMRGKDADMERDLAARVVPLVWNDMDLFRVKVFCLCDTMSEEDFSSAFEIVNKELKLEAATEIFATPPDYGATQKKSGVTSPRKPHGKYSRRRKN